MEKKTDVENERAIRIAVRMNINHAILASIYERSSLRNYERRAKGKY